MESENSNSVNADNSADFTHAPTIDLATAVRNGSADTLSRLKLKCTNIIMMSLLFVAVRLSILLIHGYRPVDYLYGFSLILFYLVFTYFTYKKRKTIDIPDKSNSALIVDLQGNISFLKKCYKQCGIMGWFVGIFFVINLIHSNGVIPSISGDPLSGWLIVLSDIIQFILSAYYLINLFTKPELRSMEELKEELED